MSAARAPRADLTTASDAELMLRVRADDVEAFEQLYARHAARAHRIAQAICHRPEVATEAVQDGFISIWRGRKTYRPQVGDAAAWVMRIMRNRAIDLARRDAVHDGRHGDTEGLTHRPALVDVSADAIATDEAKRLRALLAELPATHREVVSLAFFGELSHTEIAAHLGLPVGTVKGRMRLGLQQLRTFR